MYEALLVTLLYLFCLSIECISFVVFITSVYHNFPIAAPLVMGMWPKFSKRGVVCAQVGPRWVAIGSVPTPLSRTFGPITAGGSLAQHYRKAHHRHQSVFGVGGDWTPDLLYNYQRLFALFNRYIIVNLYQLYFPPSYFSSQPNKWVFYFSTFPFFQSNTNERKLRVYLVTVFSLYFLFLKTVFYFWN